MLNKLIIIIVKIYQNTFSLILPNSCRFYPTCSEYTIQAFTKFSLSKALFLSIKRVLKCNPFFEGGFDPLPEEEIQKDG